LTTDEENRPGERPSITGLERWQPVLVVLLVLVLATAVALVLAQSAGVIHLPFLGGSGGSSAVVLSPRG
jgi:hypothetical protein